MGGVPVPGTEGAGDGGAQVLLHRASGVGDAAALEVDGEPVAVGGVHRRHQPSLEVGSQPGGEHHGRAEVELVVDDHALEHLVAGAAQPRPVARRRLAPRHLAAAFEPEQVALGPPQGAGAEAIAEETAHRGQDVAVHPHLEPGGIEPVDDQPRAQRGHVEAASVVGDQHPPAGEAGEGGEERGALGARVDEKDLVDLEPVTPGNADAGEEGEHPAAPQAERLEVEDRRIGGIPAGGVGPRVAEREPDQLGGGDRPRGAGTVEEGAQVDAHPADPGHPAPERLGLEPRGAGPFAATLGDRRRIGDRRPRRGGAGATAETGEPLAQRRDGGGAVGGLHDRHPRLSRARCR